MYNQKGFFSTIGGFIISIYLLISQIMALYYWIQYVKIDSFIRAITLDVFIAEIKGLLWIFFIWYNKTYMDNSSWDRFWDWMFNSERGSYVCGIYLLYALVVYFIAWFFQWITDLIIS